MFPNAQDALPLPLRPNLKRYKKLAKELVKACKSVDPNAIGDWAEAWVTMLVKRSGLKLGRREARVIVRWTEQVEAFAQRKLSNGNGPRCRLADAHFVIARSHGSPLHCAAIGGQLEVIKFLLKHNAPLEGKNVYGGTVLGQTLWSAAHGGDPKLYATIIKVLIEAGAKVPERHVPVNKPIDDLLRRYGSVPEPTWYWFGEKPRRTRER